MPIPLFERSQSQIANRISRKVKTLRGVADSEVSMGLAREKPRIQLHVNLKENPGYEETHVICSIIDRQVRYMVPDARVDIRSETSELKDNAEPVWKTVKGIVEGEPGSRGAHNIHLNILNRGIGVDSVLLKASTQAAPGRSSSPEIEVGKKIKAADPRISEVVIHPVPLPAFILGERLGHGTEARCYIEHVTKSFPSLKLLGPPVIRTIGDQLYVRIRVAPMSSIGQEEVGEIGSKLKAAIKTGYQAITRVDIIEVPRAEP